MRKPCSNSCRAERTLCSVSSASSLSATFSSDSDTPSLHPVVGASDGSGHSGRDEAETATGWGVAVLRAPAATVAAHEPAGPREVHPLRAGWRWLVRLNARIEDCWIGDLLGVVLLFLIGIGAVIAAGVLQ